MEDEYCRVYWGSHGCNLARGHDGPCECECARDANGKLEPREDEAGVLNVGAPPYYGPDTNFYGEDAIDVMGRVCLSGIVVSATETRVVVSTPGTPETWSQKMNDAGEWEPWDVYGQTLNATPGHRLEVLDVDTTTYPGHLTVVVR